MKTINAAHAGEEGTLSVAADVNPVATLEASVPGVGPGDPPLAVRVTVLLGDGLPASHRRVLAEDAEARRRAEDEALDAEDVLTQAEEANALDPVG